MEGEEDVTTADRYTLHNNASLAAHNTLRVRARARQLAELKDASALPDLLDKLDGPPLVLGQGSNVLFAGDVDGSVLVMATQGVDVEETAGGARVTVAAGESWDGFVRWSLEAGFAGLENLTLIPGTVGAAPVQNIGAYGVEIAEFIDNVAAWDVQAHRAVTLDNAACAFSYRDSLFKREPDRYLVTEVCFLLPRVRPLRLEYAGVRQELARMNIAEPAPERVAEAVRALRMRKLPDPAVIGNAGSFFKNPLVPAAQAAELKRRYPGMAQWRVSNERVKLSAAWLIEACGFKGSREGDAGISDRHALVLVNHGHASGTQLWALAERVIKRVQSRFAVTLEPEPRIIGETARRQAGVLP
ncbi:MAG TPA: UDP-N-acetylmuramate dehydrogenase [Rhodanobacteraceae bacterium]|nr:UDP-N-acetylmuramate dehydrogenase [Rhodanobacteraceae bacterium]